MLEILMHPHAACLIFFVAIIVSLWLFVVCFVCNHYFSSCGYYFVFNLWVFVSILCFVSICISCFAGNRCFVVCESVVHCLGVIIAWQVRPEASKGGAFLCPSPLSFRQRPWPHWLHYCLWHLTYRPNCTGDNFQRSCYSESLRSPPGKLCSGETSTGKLMACMNIPFILKSA